MFAPTSTSTSGRAVEGRRHRHRFGELYLNRDLVADRVGFRRAREDGEALHRRRDVVDRLPTEVRDLVGGRCPVLERRRRLRICKRQRIPAAHCLRQRQRHHRAGAGEREPAHRVAGDRVAAAGHRCREAARARGQRGRIQRLVEGHGQRRPVHRGRAGDFRRARVRGHRHGDRIRPEDRRRVVARGVADLRARACGACIRE